MYKQKQHRPVYQKTLIHLSVFVLSFFLNNSLHAQTPLDRMQCNRGKLDLQSIVTFTPAPLEYDFEKTNEEMFAVIGGYENWVKAYYNVDPASIPKDDIRANNGMTLPSKFSGVFKIKLTSEAPDRAKLLACAYVKNIEIDITYNNKIILPSEHKSGSCDFNERLKYHEEIYLHDLEIGEKYKNEIKKNIYAIVTGAESSVGYMKAAEEKILWTRISKAIQDILTLYEDSMQKEQKAFQKQHNSPEQFAQLAQNIQKCKEGRLQASETVIEELTEQE